MNLLSFISDGLDFQKQNNHKFFALWAINFLDSTSFALYIFHAEENFYGDWINRL
jgi:hypothetical protein